MNEDIAALRMELHNKYCELMENDTVTNKTISGILDLIGDMRKEIVSLRTDVDKLIENNQGGRHYGKSA